VMAVISEARQEPVGFALVTAVQKPQVVFLQIIPQIQSYQPTAENVPWDIIAKVEPRHPNHAQPTQSSTLKVLNQKKTAKRAQLDICARRQYQKSARLVSTATVEFSTHVLLVITKIKQENRGFQTASFVLKELIVTSRISQVSM